MTSRFKLQPHAGTADQKKNFAIGLHGEDALALKYLCLVLCVTPEHVRATGLEIPGGN